MNRFLIISTPCVRYGPCETTCSREPTCLKDNPSARSIEDTRARAAASGYVDFFAVCWDAYTLHMEGSTHTVQNTITGLPRLGRFANGYPAPSDITKDSTQYDEGDG